MIKYICDRCGSDVAEHAFLDGYFESHETNKGRITLRGHTIYDLCLCDKCVEEWLFQCGIVIGEKND